MFVINYLFFNTEIGEGRFLLIALHYTSFALLRKEGIGDGSRKHYEQRTCSGEDVPYC